MSIQRGILRASVCAASLALTPVAARAETPPAAAATDSAASIVYLSPVGSGNQVYVSAFSADGKVVIGREYASGGALTIWTNGVPKNIPVPFGFAQDVDFFASSDGNTVVSTTYSYLDGFTGVWNSQTGQQILPDISVNEMIWGPSAISADGKTIAVTSVFGTRLVRSDGFYLGGTSAIGGGNAYLWTAAGGYFALPRYFTGPKDLTSIEDINGDASVAAGIAYTCKGGCTGKGYPIYDVRVPFVWTAQSGITPLPHLSNAPAPHHSNPLGIPFSEIAKISRDGSTIVGSSNGADGRPQAVFWRNGAVNPLGFLHASDTATRALYVNANGLIILGTGADGGNAQDPAYFWRWTSTSGMQDLSTILANAKIDLNGYKIAFINGLSDDGQTILGNVYNAVQQQQLGFLLQLAQVTRTQLIVRVQLPGQTLQSVINQSFSTEVAGTLNGQGIFNRTFADTIDSSAGLSAIAAARAALTISGLRRLTIGAPYLVSNTTSVTGSTSKTVDVLTGTQVTTATINTMGPATVTTGDLGVCTTVATATAAPTGCSLPGTPVNVEQGILNSNIYTNTIQSVTPTTTVTVSQLITAKWRIDALASNQFGTVHALVGRLGFERSDRLIDGLLDRADTPDGDGVTVGESGSGLTLFGGYFTSRSTTDADPAIPVADVRGSTDGFQIGLEKRLPQGFRIGAAGDYSTADYTVRDPLFPETLGLDESQLALYGAWGSGGLSLSAAVVYGFGEVETSIASPTGPSRASRDVSGWSFGVQAGYRVLLDDSASIGLSGGARYSVVALDPFTETGGSSPLIGLDTEVDRTRVYAGLDVLKRIAIADMGTLTLRAYARATSDSGDRSGIADLVFASAPGGPTLQAFGPAIGKTGVETGVSFDLDLSDSVSLWAAWDGAFRDGTESHSARAGLSIRF